MTFIDIDDITPLLFATLLIIDMTLHIIDINIFIIELIISLPPRYYAEI
jgi:hypothetical protein